MQTKQLLSTPDFKGFIAEAKGIFHDRIYTDFLRRFAYGVDASCYRYVPRVVVRAFSEYEIINLFLLSNKYHTPLTFRAAGTSLSGQACSAFVLVLANSRWQNIEIMENATSIKCDCGVIGVEANKALKPYRKKIGPDPATINNAMIGGIFSNNSSGMCCGIKQNSYNTIKSVRIILHDGSILDTSHNAKEHENIQAFLHRHKDKAQSLLALRERIIQDEELSRLIKRKFSIKNTTGYSINALLDFSHIKDILNHIFIGAEGTLGFVSKVEYECVDDYAYKACALLFYENLSAGAKAVEILAAHEDIVSAAEIMDYACLQSAKDLHNAPQELQTLKEGQCAILVQLEDSTHNGLQSKQDIINKALCNAPSLFGTHFSSDENTMASWWKIRKALLPLAAANRPSKSIVITEDICFPISSFTLGIESITKLFAQFNFHGIIFGHALSGNVHFIITPNLNDKQESERFGAFMEAMVDSVLAYNGSTKAEHGTGRMIAPFVEREWGKKAYMINQQIKAIFDPQGLINPDVIITNNSKIHMQNLKETSEVEDFINQCMECGFCEKVCPSRELTLTPRQRIAVRKEIVRLESKQDKTKQECDELAHLQRGYAYFGIETCATCSMCALSCPLEIDTAKIAHTLKPKMQSTFKRYIASYSTKHFHSTLALAKSGLNVANFCSKIFGNKIISNLSTQLKPMPYIPSSLPTANNYKLESKHLDSPALQVIYFSSCINRSFAPSYNMHDKRPLQEVFESLCHKAKVSIIYPHNLNNLCCAKAFKDYPEIAHNKLQETYNALRLSLQERNIAIVCDHSACSYELMQKLQKLDSTLQIYDMPQYVESVLLARLHITPRNEDIALYTMCATKKGKWDKSLESIAKTCTTGKVIKHEQTQCCGFAGNKGFTRNELNASALRELSKFYAKKQEEYEINTYHETGITDSKNINHSKKLQYGFSSSSTCEIGLNDKTHIIWQNLIYLVDSVSRGQ